MAYRPGFISAIPISTGYRAEMAVMVIIDSINYPMIARSLIADSIFDKLADGCAIADRCFDSSQRWKMITRPSAASTSARAASSRQQP